MRTKIRLNGANMVFPVMVSDSIRIPMQNRSVEMGDRERIEVITLRARKKIFGKQRYDNVKVLVEVEPLPDGTPRHEIHLVAASRFSPTKRVNTSLPSIGMKKRSHDTLTASPDSAK